MAPSANLIENNFRQLVSQNLTVGSAPTTYNKPGSIDNTIVARALFFLLRQGTFGAVDNTPESFFYQCHLALDFPLEGPPRHSSILENHNSATST